MRPVPGFFRAAGLVAAKDLRLEWRSLETSASTAIFSLIVILVFHFTFGLRSVRDLGPARVVPGVVWTTLAFASVVGLSRSLAAERSRDTLVALFLSPVDRGALWAGKTAANLVKLVVLLLLLLPMTAVFFDYDLFAVAGPLALVLFVHALGLVELGTLFAGVCTRVGRGEALLATLLFPAASPLLIAAVKCTGAVLEHGSLAGAGSWLLVALGFDVLYFFVSLLTFEFVLEE